MKIPNLLVGENDVVVRRCQQALRRGAEDKQAHRFLEGEEEDVGRRHIVLDGPGLPNGDHARVFAPMYCAKTLLSREGALEFAHALLELSWGPLAFMGQSSMSLMRDPQFRRRFLSGVLGLSGELDRLGRRFFHTGLEAGSIWELPTNIARALAKDGIPTDRLRDLDATKFSALMSELSNGPPREGA